jgi:hypothetical protein
MKWQSQVLPLDFPAVHCSRAGQHRERFPVFRDFEGFYGTIRDAPEAI